MIKGSFQRSSAQDPGGKEIRTEYLMPLRQESEPAASVFIEEGVISLVSANSGAICFPPWKTNPFSRLTRHLSDYSSHSIQPKCARGTEIVMYYISFHLPGPGTRGRSSSLQAAPDLSNQWLEEEAGGGDKLTLFLFKCCCILCTSRQLLLSPESLFHKISTSKSLMSVYRLVSNVSFPSWHHISNCNY